MSANDPKRTFSRIQSAKPKGTRSSSTGNTAGLRNRCKKGDYL